MTEIRKGEIAFLVLKHRLKKEGVHLDPNFKRDWGNTAREIGVPLEELFEFVEETIRDAVDAMFANAKK